MKRKEDFSLRPLMAEDAESLAQQLNNKKIWDHLRDRLPYPYTVDDAIGFIELSGKEPALTCYGIVVDGKVVGNITFTRGSDIERFSAEVGYYIGEPYWGQGIMSATLIRAMDDYLTTTDVVRLFATSFEHNKASSRVLEKAGFTFKCTLIKAAYKNEKFVDLCYFEKVK